MGKIIIHNLSTLEDYAAVMRVGDFIAGYGYRALYDKKNVQIVNIRCQGNNYVVSDYKEE